jgi:DNA-binding XRE family transcriptional regulator
LCEDLAKNYAELEKLVAQRVEVSKQTLVGWQQETRDLMKFVRSIRLMPANA